MSKILIHLVSGPEHPTRAALAFLVARSAAEAGHDVSVFLAGDAVTFLREATMAAAHGIGTGSLREHYTALTAAGGRVYASGMSSQAREVDMAALGPKQVEFAPPDRLVDLLVESDRIVTY